jgi:hypothetical protein
MFRFIYESSPSCPLEVSEIPWWLLWLCVALLTLISNMCMISMDMFSLELFKIVVILTWISKGRRELLNTGLHKTH